VRSKMNWLASSSSFRKIGSAGSHAASAAGHPSKCSRSRRAFAVGAAALSSMAILQCAQRTMSTNRRSS